MLVLEFKAKGKTTQYAAIDEAIRTAQFVRNRCIRFWMDNRGVGQKQLYRHNTALREEFPFVKELNSHACQASVERAYCAIARFYDNCRKSILEVLFRFHQRYYGNYTIRISLKKTLLKSLSFNKFYPLGYLGVRYPFFNAVYPDHLKSSQSLTKNNFP